MTFTGSRASAWSCDRRTCNISVDLSLRLSFSLSIFLHLLSHTHTKALCAPLCSHSFPFFFSSVNSIIKHFIPEPYLMPRALHSTLGAKCSLFPAKWSGCYCGKFLITHEVLNLAAFMKNILFVDAANVCVNSAPYHHFSCYPIPPP